MVTPTNDKELLTAIGLDALKAEKLTEWQVKKWMQRGIAWPQRGKVAKIARKHGIRLPKNFDEQRSVA